MVGGGALGIPELPDSATHEVKRAAACQTDEGVKPSREVHRVSFSVGNKKTSLAGGQTSSSSFFFFSDVELQRFVFVIDESS